MGDARVTYSVIIPTYNREPLLAQAQLSIHGARPDFCAMIVVNDGTAAASSTTKRFGPRQRARYFKHILDSQAKTLATDSNTQAWLWKRYLKMAARAGGLEGYQTLRQG